MTLVYIIFGVVLLLGFTAFTGAPYVPSKQNDLQVAFTKLYPLSAKDVLVDMGSGDGKVLRFARKFGAKAIGYEIGPVYVWLSRLLAKKDRGQQIIAKSYWGAQLPAGTTVVYAFSPTRDIKRLYRLIQSEATRLGRKLAFISYGMDVPGLKPDKKAGAHFLYMVAPCGNKKP